LIITKPNKLILYGEIITVGGEILKTLIQNENFCTIKAGDVFGFHSTLKCLHAFHKYYIFFFKIVLVNITYVCLFVFLALQPTVVVFFTAR
jgi:hypothetical protein